VEEGYVPATMLDTVDKIEEIFRKFRYEMTGNAWNCMKGTKPDGISEKLKGQLDQYLGKLG